MCPQFLFNQVVAGWTRYSPLKKKRNFDHYYLLVDEDIFYDNFHGLWFFKKIGPQDFLKIVVDDEKPAFLLYSEKLQAIALSFSYEPINCRETYVPQVRLGHRNGLKSLANKQLYFVLK